LQKSIYIYSFKVYWFVQAYRGKENAAATPLSIPDSGVIKWLWKLQCHQARWIYLYIIGLFRRFAVSITIVKIHALAGETVFTHANRQEGSAKGATAPETLRPPDRLREYFPESD